jgi:hypothetical protein
MSTRKIIQIAATASGDDPDTVYALCDDGSLWMMLLMGVPGEWVWERFPEVPAKEDDLVNSLKDIGQKI